MVRLIKNIILSFLIAVLFMASGGVNIYYHFCSHGHDEGIFALVEPECHDDTEDSHCCCESDCCSVMHEECMVDKEDCCTNHHEFINVITDFIPEQEFNVPAPLFLKLDRLLPDVIYISCLENPSDSEVPDPPDIQICETGRDLVCLVQNFRIGDCHIA